MDYTIVGMEKFQLLTKVQAFRNTSVSEKGNTEIPDFWKQCGADGTFDILKRHSKIHDTYGENTSTRLSRLISQVLAGQVENTNTLNSGDKDSIRLSPNLFMIPLGRLANQLPMIVQANRDKGSFRSKK